MKNLFNRLLIATLLMFAGISGFAQNPVQIKISEPKSEIPIQQNMFGIFFEDINFAADGGLYAMLMLGNIVLQKH